MSSESAEPPGWLRLGDLAIGDGGVCVTSLIKDKIREYMLNEEHQQTPSSSAKTAAAAAASKSGGTCVRRIGNSLDLLLRESRNAGHAVAATSAKNKPSAATAATVAADDRYAVSTTICAPADSSRPTVDGPPPPPPLPPIFAKRYLITQDEMQISRMPIPADDANSEMSVDTNPSDTKSDLETTTKVNGDSHKKLNGSVVDDSKETDEASEVVDKKEETNLENKTESSESIDDEPLKNGSSKDEESEENVEEIIKKEIATVESDTLNHGDKSVDSDVLKDNEDKDKGEKDKGEPVKGEQDKDEQDKDEQDKGENDEGEKDEVEKVKEEKDEVAKVRGEKDEVEKDEVAKVKGEKDEVVKVKGEKDEVEKVKGEKDEVVKVKGEKDDVKVKGEKDDVEKVKGEKDDVEKVKGEKDDVEKVKGEKDYVEKVKGEKDEDKEEMPMEIDESEDHQNENITIQSEYENLTIKKKHENVKESEVTEHVEIQEIETLKNGDINHSDEVIKNVEREIFPVNGEVKLDDEEKSSKSEKVCQKVLEEEDMSSEMSTDTLSPKQIDEPIARKRSAASHDELSVVSGASSDNDLPKTKKLRSDEDAPLLKDDTRERLIKNIVQSSGKNEVELSRNIEKIQNEIKVITEIAQTKRDELVTLIRLQKLKEEIIERLMIKVKEFDAAKIDNSKDWNLPEMFQINLSQPEHILSEKNINDIIDNRDTQLEKSSVNSHDQNIYVPTSNTSITAVASSSNAQSNDWIMSDRANRANRIQRPILPKPISVNNQKEGRQGPILDVKLIIADHRSKNPETAVPKRGRRKAVANDFSVPTSSAPLRYPNPMGFNSNLHHVNDGNFKNTITNHTHGVPNNVLEHGSDHNRFKDVPAFPEVTLHPVSQLMQPQQQQHQQPTSLLHGILTKGAGTHHLPLSMSNPPTNYSPTLARLLTAPERCKQSRGKQRQTPAATVVSSNTQSRNEITITPVQSTSMSSTFQQKLNVAANIPPAQVVDDEDASDRLVIDEGQDAVNANSPTNAPQCQGCMQKPAQFVCAGCGNQWYCSKDCQIDAWDNHSEVCNG